MGLPGLSKAAGLAAAKTLLPLLPAEAVSQLGVRRLLQKPGDIVLTCPVSCMVGLASLQQLVQDVLRRSVGGWVRMCARVCAEGVLGVYSPVRVAGWAVQGSGTHGRGRRWHSRHPQTCFVCMPLLTFCTEVIKPTSDHHKFFAPLVCVPAGHHLSYDPVTWSKPGRVCELHPAPDTSTAGSSRGGSSHAGPASAGGCLSSSGSSGGRA